MDKNEDRNGKEKYGKLTGLGVGPGDPELMTLKAVRLIQENTCFAVPGKGHDGEQVCDSMAWKIAVQAVPELKEKRTLLLPMPMVRDAQELSGKHREAADIVEEVLKTGENVVFLTLGDPALYSTYTWLQKIIEEDGFETDMVSGVTSFSAAAAALNEPLTLWNEPLHIIPAAHEPDIRFMAGENYVLMKTGKCLKEMTEKAYEAGRKVSGVENCGLENEKIWHDASGVPEEAGYFSLLLIK